MRLFLVYAECVCGWRCACGEGATWPECPLCGEQVLPPEPAEHLNGVRGRVGLVAELMEEQEAREQADAPLAPMGAGLTLLPGGGFPLAGGAQWLPRVYHP